MSSDMAEIMWAPPLLKDLYEEHKDKLRDARRRIAERLSASDDKALLAESERYVNDQTIVRYILSNKKVSKGFLIGDMVYDTLGFRVAHAEALLPRDSDPIPGAPNKHYLGNPIGGVGMHCGQFLAFGAIDQRVMLEECGGPEGFAEQCVHFTETFRREIHAKSEETGRLIKIVTIADVSGLSLSSVHMPFMRVVGGNSKNNELHFPQLIGKIVLLRAPRLISMVIGLARPLVSARTMEKLMICYGSAKSGATGDSCPFIKKLEVKLEYIPVNSGGKLIESKAMGPKSLGESKFSSGDSSISTASAKTTS